MVENNQPKELKSHQDYSKWVITGKRFFIVSPDHSEYFGEYEEVISVEGEKCICNTCGKTTLVWKPCMNTPSFHASAEGVCNPCHQDWMQTYDNIRWIREEDMHDYMVKETIGFNYEVIIRADSEEGALEAAEQIPKKAWNDVTDERQPDEVEVELYE